MKSAFASLLLLLNLLSHPEEVLSFTASRPLVAVPRRTTTELNVKLPGFLSGNKEDAVDETPVAKIDAPSQEEECVTEKDLNPMNKIKEFGAAGAISLFLWEGAFWAIGGGGAAAAYFYANGHFPSTKEEMAVAGGEAFAFANVARLFLPARIALAIATAPWVDENIVKKFSPADDDACLVPEKLD